MTTQINVIVDNGGLSEKARRQTQANRWSKLEGDNRQKVEATGTKQRDANRAQQGIGPDGRPLYGTPPAQPLRRDEPAAWRTGLTVKIGHTWLETFNDAAPASTGLFGGATISSGYTAAAGELGRVVTNAVRSGNASSSLAAIASVGYKQPALPVSGFSWQPTYGAFYDSGYGWRYSAFGLRTYRWYDSEKNEFVVPLVLPAGQGLCVVFLFRYAVSWCIDVTTMHRVIIGPFAGSSGTVPTLSQIQSEFAFQRPTMTSAGGEVTVGRPFMNANPYKPYSYATGGPVAIDLPIAYYVNETPFYQGFFDGYDQNNNASVTTTALHQSTTKSTEVYICGGTSVRRLEPSLTTQAFIDYWNPPTDTTKVVWLSQAAGNQLNVSVTAPATNFKLSELANLDTASLFYESDGFSSRTWDPHVYKSLNEQYQFTDPANILSEEAVKYRARSDTRLGAYALEPESYNDYINSGQPFYYALSPINSSPATLGKKAGSVGISSASAPFTAGAEFHRVWDWGDPGYCRQQLFALGFTEADLTP